MKYTIIKVDHLPAAPARSRFSDGVYDGEEPATVAKISVTVKLDAELAQLLGRTDMSILLSPVLCFDFVEGISEAAMISSIRNELVARRVRAQVAGKVAHLVGKEFDL